MKNLSSRVLKSFRATRRSAVKRSIRIKLKNTIVRSHREISYGTLADRWNQICWWEIRTQRVFALSSAQTKFENAWSNERNIDYDYYSKYDESFFFTREILEYRRRKEIERRRSARNHTVCRLVWKFNEASVQKLREKNYSTHVKD